MQVEDLEMLRDMDHTEPRVRLRAFIAQLSDADAAALWSLLCSWYTGTQQGPNLKALEQR